MKQIASLRFLILLLLVPLTLGQCWAGSSVFPLTVTNFVVSRCDHPFMFGFGSWEKAKTNFAVKPDGIHIAAKDGKGGAGVAGLSVQFSEVNDWTPALIRWQTPFAVCGDGRVFLEDGRGFAGEPSGLCGF